MDDDVNGDDVDDDVDDVGDDEDANAPSSAPSIARPTPVVTATELACCKRRLTCFVNVSIRLLSSISFCCTLDNDISYSNFNAWSCRLRSDEAC